MNHDVTHATRWTQLTFTEDDPAHADVDRWIDIMQRTQSQGLCISAGGYTAYYPTAVPYHHRSNHLGRRDLFGEMVDAARSLGMSVMARIDPHAVHPDAASAHPEWLARDGRGEPIRHRRFADAWFTCPFGPYHREVVPAIAREIVREYGVDAIFANRWEGHGGISYSDAASRGFRTETGLDLPQRADDTDPAWSAYVRWRRRQLTELITIWNAAVTAERPGTLFIPNRGAMQLRDLDAEVAAPFYPTFFIDKQGREPGEAIWAAGRVGRRSRGSYPDRPVRLITSVGPEHPLHRWKDSVDSAAELKTWIVDGFVHGATPWFTKFSASIHDDRWIEPIIDAFGLHATVEQLFAETTPTADVALLDVLAVDERNPFDAYNAASASEDGLHHALLEARIPFEYLDTASLGDGETSAERLNDVRVLVLPTTSGLPEETVHAIRRFVHDGGAVLACHDGPSDHDGGFALGDVFGIRPDGDRCSAVLNNYVEFDDNHPIRSGFGNAARIIGGTETVPVALLPAAQAPIRFTPAHPDLPMEEVYPRPGIRRPAVVTNSYGRGRTVFCAFNLGEVFWENLLQDHQRLIANGVNWLLGDAARFAVRGEGLVDIACREAGSTSVVSIVNMNSPFAMRGQLRTIEPLGPQMIEVRGPVGATRAVAELQVTNKRVAVAVEDGTARFEIPEVEVLETARIEWVAS